MMSNPPLRPYGCDPILHPQQTPDYAISSCDTSFLALLLCVRLLTATCLCSFAGHRHWHDALASSAPRAVKDPAPRAEKLKGPAPRAEKSVGIPLRYTHRLANQPTRACRIGENKLFAAVWGFVFNQWCS